MADICTDVAQAMQTRLKQDRLLLTGVNRIMERGLKMPRIAALAALNLVGLVALQPGCGSLDVQEFMADNACNIFNCQTLFFIDDLFASPHDDGDDDHDGMDMDDDHEDAADVHDDGNDDHGEMDMHDDEEDLDDDHGDTDMNDDHEDADHAHDDGDAVDSDHDHDTDTESDKGHMDSEEREDDENLACSPRVDPGVMRVSTAPRWGQETHDEEEAALSGSNHPEAA